MTIFNAILTSNLSNTPKTGDFSMYSIRPNPRFQGAFIVSTPNGDVECANLSTARSYVPDTNEYRRMQAQRPVVQQRATASIECKGFVSPSGQYYAVVEMPTMDIRIDCHNVHTLRSWLRDGVTPGALLEAFRNPVNVRRTGGWCA